MIFIVDGFTHRLAQLCGSVTNNLGGSILRESKIAISADKASRR